MNWNEAFARLESLTDWPSIRREKCRAFFELAQHTSNGCIVELGTYRGVGAAALALGAAGGVPVHTIDDGINKKGWANENYGPEDNIICATNLARAGVTVTCHRQDVRVLASTWTIPVGLLVWDIGNFGRMCADLVSWESHVVPGGLFVAKEIDTVPGGFGFADLVTWNKWELGPTYPSGLVYTLRKLL